MATLIVRNIDDRIIRALKVRAARHGVSAEAEHRRIRKEVLLRPEKRPFSEVLADIPPGATRISRASRLSPLLRCSNDVPARY